MLSTLNMPNGGIETIHFDLKQEHKRYLLPARRRVSTIPGHLNDWRNKISLYR